MTEFTAKANIPHGRNLVQMERLVLGLDRHNHLNDMVRDAQGWWCWRWCEQTRHAVLDAALHVAVQRALSSPCFLRSLLSRRRAGTPKSTTGRSWRDMAVLPCILVSTIGTTFYGSNHRWSSGHVASLLSLRWVARLHRP